MDASGMPDPPAAPGRAAEERYPLLFERNPAAVYRTTLEGRVVDCSESLARIFGYVTPREIIGQNVSDRYFDPADRAPILERLRSEGALTNLDLRLRRRDGSPVWVLANVGLVEGPGGEPLIEGTLVDVTDRTQAAEKVLWLNRLYSVSSSLRQVIIRVASRQQLLQEVCRIAVEKGLFRMAWFGVLDEVTERVIPVAHAGHALGYVDNIRISLADEPEGHGPTGTALRERRRFVCNDIAGDARMLPWRDEALQRGYRASAAFPVQVQGRLIGALNIYAVEPGFFDEENVSLLEEMAADVAFALENLDREEQRERAEQERAQALAREEVARAQARAEARFRELLEAAPDAILEIDRQDTVLLVNAATEQLFGYDRQELLGLPLDRLLAERSRGAYQRLRAACLAHPGGRPQAPEELSARRKDGREFFAEMTLNPAHSEEGGPITCAIRDVTERKHLEEQLRQSQKMEALGRLAGGVAHDFNNLLTIIGGYSQMLLSGVRARDPARRDLESIAEAANRASALTRQLLAFSRRQVVQPKVLDLNRLIARMHRMLRPVIGEDIELRLNLQRNLGRVKADPGQLEQVVMNLVVNARDALPQGGWITIETREIVLTADAAPVALPAGTYVALAVSDSGEGIDAETLPHVFEPFFTTKLRGKGSGLGLSTVYGIVKQSGGEIQVSSEVGQGSTFRIYLPVFRAPAKRREIRAAPVRAATGEETILLVEDEAGVRRLAREMLLRQGYTVLEAASGPDALELWSQHGGAIDLLVTDVVMPQMSGRELAERLREARPDLKVLYMSGYTNDVIARHGVLEAEVAFLQKPFAAESLGRKVRTVLDQDHEPASR